MSQKEEQGLVQRQTYVIKQGYSAPKKTLTSKKREKRKGKKENKVILPHLLPNQ